VQGSSRGGGIYIHQLFGTSNVPIFNSPPQQPYNYAQNHLSEIIGRSIVALIVFLLCCSSLETRYSAEMAANNS